VRRRVIRSHVLEDRLRIRNRPIRSKWHFEHLVHRIVTGWQSMQSGSWTTPVSAAPCHQAHWHQRRRHHRTLTHHATQDGRSKIRGEA
jgi:hypothetical protein